MTVKRSDVEIMAPVGCYESLAAAVQAGADSIYFGVEQLNMRARSSFNFTLDDLSRIVSEAGRHGIKTYLTVNTILYDEDLPEMRRIMDRARSEGVDAVIASDQAAIFYARSIGLEVHISTQLNLSNIETVAFYAQYADVVVLARELSLAQVRAIADGIRSRDLRGPKGEPLRIEMFAHGALCMAVSGKCYLSLHESAHSANRGSCRQICRRAYTVRDRESGEELVVDNKYIMSPKDLCTVDFLDRFLDAGVRVLKIEGRARSADYVKRVVECYDEALRAIEEGTYTPERAEQWKERLRTVFNRGFWGGYYMGARAGWGFWLKAGSSTFLSWSSRYLVANALIMAFFSVSDQFLLFARQLVMWIMMLIMPTPGGSGFAEYVFSTYCRDLIVVPPAMQLGAATLIALLWRGVTYYPYLAIGAIIFPRWIKRKFGKKNPSAVAG